MKLWYVVVTMKDDNPRSRMVWNRSYAVIAETEIAAAKLGRSAATSDLPEYAARVIAVRASECDSPVLDAGAHWVTRKKYEEAAVHFPPTKMDDDVDVPRDACPKCRRTLVEHGLDFTSQAPLVVVTCPPAKETA